MLEVTHHVGVKENCGRLRKLGEHENVNENVYDIQVMKNPTSLIRKCLAYK